MLTVCERLERDLAMEIEAINKIAHDMAERARLLSCTQDPDTMLEHYVRIKQLMENLTTRYEWSRYAAISLSVHQTIYR